MEPIRDRRLRRHGAEIIGLKGYNDEYINAYFARPSAKAARWQRRLVHHLPGWDEFYRETTRRFAQHGYATLCPNLYHRFGPRLAGRCSRRGPRAGRCSDASVIGDCEAARELPSSAPVHQRQGRNHRDLFRGRFPRLSGPSPAANRRLQRCMRTCGAVVVQPEDDTSTARGANRA